jgi:hypothetical protein
VSLDNADTVIEGGPHLRRESEISGRAPLLALF